ncbi:MAG: hypothetical protein HZA27_00560 [Candidatus Omnitrophica bacterium]|nr:hypothetical protein [Candidatus Omnitrophota bacterium]
MKDNNLLKKVGALGFPLFGPQDDQNANLTLAQVVKSKDLRLWEGFPVVLANSAEKGLFNYDKVNYYLKKPLERSYFTSLVALSLALYKLFNLKFSWSDRLFKVFSKEGKKEFNMFLSKLKNDGEFQCAGREMSSLRLKSVFGNYFNQAQKRLEDLLSVKDELSLEYVLSQVFSPKQKELFYKKLKREKLTKTETEYFSRVVKKKVLALANSDLHRLSQKLLG